jgi:hypothetical protein
VSAPASRGAEPGARALVFSVVAPPAAWALHLGVSYALTTPVCEAGARWVLHLVWAAAVALSLSAGGVAWRERRAIGGRDGGARDFLLVAALAWSAFLTLTIVAAWLPVLGAACR